MSRQEFKEISSGFFVDAEYVEIFRKMSLTSIDAVFDFDAGDNLSKANMAGYRSRLRFELGDCGQVVFLKRYDRPPILMQLKNWLSHLKRCSTAYFDFLPTVALKAANINTPKTIAYGQQWSGVFEKRSFIIMEKISNAEALERKLPDFFYNEASAGTFKQRCDFIENLADFTKRFHASGLRHRDFYLAHIFLDDDGQLYLIDLQRAFKPKIFTGRFRVKDIAQLHYSSPGEYFSCTDRVRFYLRYSGKTKLGFKDKLFISRVKAKAWRMALHDMKHGRDVPFAI